MKSKIIWAVIVVFFLCIALIAYYRKNPLQPALIINNHRIIVEVAVTEAEKERGLGYRDSLPPDHGMIFLYDHKDYFPFWMKGMNFPLDFVWIDGDTVVDITPEVPVLTGNQISLIKPKVPVDKILELNSGAIMVYGIKIGDKVTFKN